MTADENGSGRDPWQAWLEAVASAGGATVAAPSSGSPWPGANGAGLEPVAAWYRRVSQELGTLMAARSSDAAFRTGLAEFARAFFADGAAARMPGFSGRPLASTGLPFASLPGSLAAFGFAEPPRPGFAPGGPAAAALGPAREQQRRAAALAAAAAEYAAAQQALAPLLAAAAGAAATAFAERVASGPPRGVRASLELWIECAENAWQDLAHGEAWCAAQARAIDATLGVVASQNDIVEDAARLAGLPSRRELDELQRRVRALERGE